jgi:hypothetical protein
MGAFSKTARNVVFAFSLAQSSDCGNGIALFILLTVAQDDPRKKPAMGYDIPWCSRFGRNLRISSSLPVFDFTIGGPIRACEGHMSLQNRNSLWKTWEIALLSVI